VYPAHLLALHRFEFIPVPFPLCSRYSTTPNQTPFFTRASLPVMLPVCDYLAPFFTRLPRPPTVANSARRVLGSPPFNIGSAVPSCVPQHARQRQRILSFCAPAHASRGPLISIRGLILLPCTLRRTSCELLNTSSSRSNPRGSSSKNIIYLAIGAEKKYLTRPEKKSKP
jgi:hypothetical protein